MLIGVGLIGVGLVGVCGAREPTLLSVYYVALVFLTISVVWITAYATFNWVAVEQVIARARESEGETERQRSRERKSSGCRGPRAPEPAGCRAAGRVFRAAQGHRQARRRAAGLLSGPAGA